MNNLFGLGPKALFWLRLYANISQASVVGSLFTEIMTMTHGKWIVGSIGLAGLIARSVASGDPSATKI